MKGAVIFSCFCVERPATIKKNYQGGAMKTMIVRFLEEAFAGESQAHMKYLVFAQQAEKEGFSNVARLFRAIAFAEQVHATNHLRTLGLIKRSLGNLEAAAEGESFEIEDMYPAYIAAAHAQEEQKAERTFNYALEAEKIHFQMYERAKDQVMEGKDVDIGDIYICELCGYTAEGSSPERCPVCGATRKKFRKF